MVAFTTAIVDIFISVGVDVLGEALTLSARGASVSVAASQLVSFESIFMLHIHIFFAEMIANLLIAIIYRRISKLAIASILRWLIKMANSADCH